jgi:hypothetical protein
MTARPFKFQTSDKEKAAVVSAGGSPSLKYICKLYRKWQNKAGFLFMRAIPGLNFELLNPES